MIKFIFFLFYIEVLRIGVRPLAVDFSQEQDFPQSIFCGFF
jgi:hypothetical protein